MNLHELREQLSKTRYTLLLVVVMLIMVFIGFQLAQVNRDHILNQLNTARTTTNNLATENTLLTTETHELRAKIEIATLENEALDKQILEGLRRERALRERIAFYQKVVAPELTEDGFSIDNIELVPSRSENYFQLSMVLLQQTRVKDTISGELNIQLVGSSAGIPTRINLLDVVNEVDAQALRYSFKYFQSISLRFQKPLDFVPEQIEINTTIYQYRKPRGDYSNRIEWPYSADGD